MTRKSLFLLIALFPALMVSPYSTHAALADGLRVDWVNPHRYSKEILDDTRQHVPRSENFPDGRVSLYTSDTIIGAWYGLGTERYEHSALGDKIEGSALRVKLKSGPVISYVLPKRQVFEDIAPRITDLDGDGRVEVVTIITEISKGASIGIFGLGKDGKSLEVVGTSGFLEKRNRWLNIAGISNFTSKKLQIAYVEAPHVLGKLIISDFVRGGYLKPVVELEGFSNHAFGSAELRLSAIVDFNEDNRGDLVIPSKDRRTLHVLGLKDKKFQSLASVRMHTQIDKAIRVEGQGHKAHFIVGLSDGTVFDISAD